MSEAKSPIKLSMADTAPLTKKPTKTKKPSSKRKPKERPEGFPKLIALLNDWSPADPTASLDLLVSELQITLEAKHHACVNACIPQLIVDGSCPIEIMHYHGQDDIDEFITRMLWMHKIFKSSIGLLIGVSDEETAGQIEDICRSLLNMEEDCVVQLL
ncbi:MAG: hypothetical protein LUQ16_02140 [Methanomassiliicoccales archaeon]|jgi:hypothetical protein|nr:hypothetical protein [Methanomassiliicoccales archaeon]MDD1755212.1 hypothetical protein [Methanomassiliicoccales archaeon]